MKLSLLSASLLVASFSACNTVPIVGADSKACWEDLEKSATEDARPDDVADVIKTNFAGFQNCFISAGFDRGVSDGRFTFGFLIEKDGKATKVCPREVAFEAKNFQECMAEVIRGATFPLPPDGGRALVQYPFFFTFR